MTNLKEWARKNEREILDFQLFSDMKNGTLNIFSHSELKK